MNSDGHDEVFLLSERVSQDSVENYFAQQRARGGRNDNPTFEQCLKMLEHYDYKNRWLLIQLEGTALEKDDCSATKVLFLQIYFLLYQNNTDLHINRYLVAYILKENISSVYGK